MNAKDYSKRWKTSERSGLSPILDTLEYFVPVLLDPSGGENGEQFDLYYFVQKAADFPTFKSVLFCAGGPGQIVRTLDKHKTYVDFLFQNGYNVVFFHLRGTGFSQIPAATKNDRFLKSEYAIRDMESIRRHFHEEILGGKDVKWEAVIGWSFGTILAQRYAHFYRNSVRKLVLISPLSRHRFADSEKAFEEYYNEMLDIYRQTLAKIYKSDKEELQNEFGDMKPDEINYILDRLFGADSELKQTEEAFGSIQTIIDLYSKLPKAKFPKSQKRSQNFYRSLRDLRFCGSNSIDDSAVIYEAQRLIGKTLRDEVLGRNVQTPERRGQDSDSASISGLGQNSHRAYYSFGVQDGINWVFMREHVKGASVRNAIHAIGGLAQLNPDGTEVLNEWLEKVGIDAGEVVRPWDPKRYWNDVPSLILNGGADPVTAAGQAERYYHPDPPGATTLIIFPGIGHNISLGGIELERSGNVSATHPLLNGAIHIEPPEIPSGQVREVTGIAKGWSLDSNLCISLKEPEELHGAIEIFGCGILSPGKWGGHEAPGGSVVALIKNCSDRDITITESNWKMEMRLFTGIVRFARSEPMSPGSIRLIDGKLIYGERNRRTEYEIAPKNGLQSGLKLVGYNLKPPHSVELWIQNDSDSPLDERTGEWIIKSENFERTFKVNLPQIPAHQLIPMTWAIDGFSVNINEKLTVEPPNELAATLVACLQPQREGSKRLSFTVWYKPVLSGGKHPNQSQSGLTERPGAPALTVDQREWHVRSPAFSVTVVLDSFKLSEGEVTTVEGDVTGIEWEKCLELKPKIYPEPPLEMVCYNIKSENQISLLLRNPSRDSFKGKPCDWIYAIPTSNAALAELDQAFKCLLFSFLVLEPQQFCKREENEILDRILSKFERAGLKVTVMPPQAENIGSDIKSAADFS
jgi:pimeloyl-ACP methyl ester carboxylesterase